MLVKNCQFFMFSWCAIFNLIKKLFNTDWQHKHVWDSIGANKLSQLTFSFIHFGHMTAWTWDHWLNSSPSASWVLLVDRSPYSAQDVLQIYSQTRLCCSLNIGRKLLSTFSSQHYSLLPFLWLVVPDHRSVTSKKQFPLTAVIFKWYSTYVFTLCFSK